MKKILPILIVSAFLFVGSLFLRVSNSFAANFYLTPSSGTVQLNNNITVTVKLDLQGVRTATTKMALSYDQTKLKYVGMDTSMSPLQNILSKSGGNGRVQVTEYNVGEDGPPAIPPIPATGTFTFATITFTALTDSGSTVLSFLTVRNSDSTVYNFDNTAPPPAESNSGAAVSTTGTSSTYILTGAVVNPPPPPTGVKPPPPVGGGVKNPPPPPAVITPPPTDSSTKVVTGVTPKITDIRITDSSETSVTIEWKTDQDSTSVVYYGTSTSYGFSFGSINYTKAHKIVLPQGGRTKLTAKATYHFKVASTNPAGNTSTSSDQTFKTENLSAQKGLLRNIGLALIIGGLIALVVVVFFFFKNRGKMSPDAGVNTNPPI